MMSADTAGGKMRSQVEMKVLSVDRVDGTGTGMLRPCNMFGLGD